jgi:hypothetical protein
MQAKLIAETRAAVEREVMERYEAAKQAEVLAAMEEKEVLHQVSPVSSHFLTFKCDIVMYSFLFHSVNCLILFLLKAALLKEAQEAAEAEQLR